jgi:hypothetical protein
LRRDYPRIAGLEEFLAWEEPNTVRVLLGHWIEEDPSGQSALVSEARIKPVDGRARLRIRTLWMLVGHFDGLIESEVLRSATQRAERPEVGLRPGSRDQAR